jgi:hypothetical protein
MTKIKRTRRYNDLQNTTPYTKYWVTQTPLIRGEPMRSGRVSNSYSTGGIRRATLVLNPSWMKTWRDRGHDKLLRDIKISHFFYDFGTLQTMFLFLFTIYFAILIISTLSLISNWRSRILIMETIFVKRYSISNC